MVCMQYGNALGTFGEQRRSPNALQCFWVHLESVFALQMYPMCYHSAYRLYLERVFALLVLS